MDRWSEGFDSFPHIIPHYKQEEKEEGLYCIIKLDNIFRTSLNFSPSGTVIDIEDLLRLFRIPYGVRGKVLSNGKRQTSATKTIFHDR